jgi:hypothetical protein
LPVIHPEQKNRKISRDDRIDDPYRAKYRRIAQWIKFHALWSIRKKDNAKGETNYSERISLVAHSDLD